MKVVTVTAVNNQRITDAVVLDGGHIIREYAKTLQVGKVHDVLTLSRFALAQGFCETNDSKDFEPEELQEILDYIVDNAEKEHLYVNGSDHGLVWTKTFAVSGFYDYTNQSTNRMVCVDRCI